MRRILEQPMFNMAFGTAHLTLRSSAAAISTVFERILRDGEGDPLSRT